MNALRAGHPPHEPRDPSRYARVARALATRGYAIEPGFLPASLVTTLAQLIRADLERGSFRHARVGVGPTRALRPEIRTDRVRWIDPAEARLPEHRCLRRMERLRRAINRELFLGLFDFEAHLTAYPPGARYVRHLDRFREARERVVSCVLYLNEGWCATDGGALRLYPDGGPEPSEGERFLDVSPRAGTLVAFLSAELPHEVLPARRERLSVTGWFRTRA